MSFDTTERFPLRISCHCATRSSHAPAPFPPLVWIVILGTFMVRTSFFMVWPFLSILLYREYDLSASGIGMLLGGAAVLSCLIGFYVGWLSDRLGRRTILLLGCVLSCGAYLLLGFGHSLWLIALGVFGSGLSYAFIDTPGKALMGICCPRRRSGSWLSTCATSCST